MKDERNTKRSRNARLNLAHKGAETLTTLLNPSFRPETVEGWAEFFVVAREAANNVAQGVHEASAYNNCLMGEQVAAARTGAKRDDGALSTAAGQGMPLTISDGDLGTVPQHPSHTIYLEPDDFDEFCRVMEEPTAPNDRLINLLRGYTVMTSPKTND